MVLPFNVIPLVMESRSVQIPGVGRPLKPSQTGIITVSPTSALFTCAWTSARLQFAATHWCVLPQPTTWLSDLNTQTTPSSPSVINSDESLLRIILLHR